jgi:hypothetical protein
MLIAVIGATAVQAQTLQETKSTDGDKKVLRKIKRKMVMVDFKEHIALGRQAKTIVTCVVKDDKTIGVTDVQGRNQQLNQAIIDNLEKHPVRCEDQENGKEFSFVLTFKHVPI